MVYMTICHTFLIDDINSCLMVCDEGGLGGSGVVKKSCKRLCILSDFVTISRYRDKQFIAVSECKGLCQSHIVTWSFGSMRCVCVCQIHIIILYAFECKNLGFVLIRSIVC